MDFIEGLLASNGKDKIFVVVHRLTKHAQFMAIINTDTTKQIVDVFFRNIYKLHGFHKVIVSDRDVMFKGKFWKDFCHQAGLSLNMSSSYHPKANGQIEIINKCLETYLHCFVTDRQNRWTWWLHLAKWWYNNTYHTLAKMTPFQSLYGYEPLRWKEFSLLDSRVPVVKDHLGESQRVINLLKENLTMAHNRMKQPANQHRSKRELKERD